jgi:hypothetical protein
MTRKKALEERDSVMLFFGDQGVGLDTGLFGDSLKVSSWSQLHTG